MKLRKLDNGDRQVTLDFRIQLPVSTYRFTVTERIFSKVMLTETVASFKEVIRNKITTQVYQYFEKQIKQEIKESLDLEYRRLIDAFPVPLPVEELITDKPKRVRCSRQLSQSELEEIRARLLTDLEDLAR